jgi:hypothetical protein
MASFNPTLGLAVSTGATSKFNSLSQASRAWQEEWNASVAYPLGALVGCALVISAYDPATSYNPGDLVYSLDSDGSANAYVAAQASTSAAPKVPYILSETWTAISLSINVGSLTTGAFASVYIFDLLWKSMVDNNENNTPAAQSAKWAITSPPPLSGIGVPTECVGPLGFVPPVWPTASETQGYIGPETLNNNQGASAPQGGFALVAGSAGTQTRSDTGTAFKLVIKTLAPTIAASGSFQMVAELTNSRGTILIPGSAPGIPALVWTSATVADVTIAAKTGLATNVATGSSVITVAADNLSATTTATAS